MEKVRLFNYYNNGSDSKVNVYFANGNERHKTIDSSDVQKLAHEWEMVSKNVICEVLIAHFILRQVGYL